MPNRYSDEEKAANRAAYERTRSGDMLGFAAMIGDSFAARINLLAQIIRDQHDASLGRYKENLLTACIRDLLPSRFAVGNGFVMFPKPGIVENPGRGRRLVTEDHEISKQLDIIVYDSSRYPCVFRDGDFVILRPESVRAVIEVKGILNPEEVDNSVDLFCDYGKKSRRYFDFCVNFGIGRPHKPSFMLMAWAIYVDKEGRPTIDGTRLRQRIIERYRTVAPGDEASTIPLLRAAMIYNDCEVSLQDWEITQEPIDEANRIRARIKVGYRTFPGYFVRKTEAGAVLREGDSTIASLISRIQNALGRSHSPLFTSYVKDDAATHSPHEHGGYDEWFQSSTMASADEMNYWATRVE